MKSHVIPLCPVLDVNHPFAYHIPPVSHLWLLDGSLHYCSACVQVTLILLDNGPKPQQ